MRLWQSCIARCCPHAATLASTPMRQSSLLHLPESRARQTYDACYSTTSRPRIYSQSPRAFRQSTASHLKTMPESASKEPLVWIDCEMTGLDPERDTILSIACYITDAQLNLLDETGYLVVIHHDEKALDSMGEWCMKHHGLSGLTGAALNSDTTAEEAAKELLDYIKMHVRHSKRAVLAGNSIHQDKAFLRKKPFDMVLNYLHYRMLDVSSIKEAARRWAPDSVLEKTPKKEGLHDAKADILESIAEAKYYREKFFQVKS